MSLPLAPKDDSETPQAGSVTAPTDKGTQAADVDRKIWLYGVIQALRQGRMPDNAQIDKALKYLRDAEPVDFDKLSPDGKQLIQDSRNIIETARFIVEKRNADELFQNFVWNTREVDMEAAPTEPAQVDRAKLTEDSRVAIRHLRVLLSLILTNSDVRKLLSDFSVIGRDLLAKGSSRAAGALWPSAHVHKPAPEGEFVTAGGRRVGTGETPVLDVNIPRTDVRVEQHPPTDRPVIKTGGGEETTGGQIPSEGKEVVWSARKPTTDTGDQPAKKLQEATVPAEPQGVTVGTSPEEEGKKRDLKDRLKGVMSRPSTSNAILEDSRVTEHLPQDSEKRAAKQPQIYLMTDNFPGERRDQFIYRGKKVIVECQKHDDYQDAIKWLLSVAEEYVELGQGVSGKGKESAGNSIINDPSLRQAASELRQLLESFANGKGMHVIFDSIGAINNDARHDEEFRAWFKRLGAFVRKMLLEAGYVLEADCGREGREIRESGRRFWDEKYRTHFDTVFYSISNWFTAVGEDPINKKFGDDWGRLTKGLLFDNEGSLKFKLELWSDIHRMIVPALVDQIGYFPIPRIEYSNDTLDFVLENITLQGRNLFPNMVTMATHNYFKFSPYISIPDEHHHEFTFTFAQMQANNVAFFFRKKTGFPKVMDSGMANVVIEGTGLTADVHVTSAGKDRSSVFKVKDVRVEVDSLKFTIHDSKHDLLYKTLKLLVTGLVKRQIKRAIAGVIRTGMEYVDGQLVSVRDGMKEARSSNEENRTQVLRELFQLHKEEHSLRLSESNSQLKVVSSKRSSVIDTGHPSGWVSHISESETKATTGKNWRSEAFTIV